MIADAVYDRAHAVFANPEVDVTARIVVASEIAAALDVIEGRTVQIGAAAHAKRQRFREWLQHVPPGFARRELGIIWKRRNLIRQIRRNFFLDRIIELARQ